MYEQEPLFELEPTRQNVIDELNRLTERRWDLTDELAAVELGRAACFAALREDQ